MTGPIPPGEEGDPRGGPRNSGPRERISLPKAFVLLVVAVILGVILLNVATRGTTSSTTTTTTTTTSHGATTTTRPGSSTTAHPGSSTTAAPSTTAPHGSTTTTPTTRPTTTPTTAPKSSTKLLVANGTSTPNAAANYTTRLQRAGWSTLSPVDTTTPVSTSAVYYASGHKTEAQSLATSLGLKATAVQPLTTSVPVSGTTGADLVLVLGPDLASQSSSSSSTTAA